MAQAKKCSYMIWICAARENPIEEVTVHHHFDGERLSCTWRLHTNDYPNARRLVYRTSTWFSKEVIHTLAKLFVEVNFPEATYLVDKIIADSTVE